MHDPLTVAFEIRRPWPHTDAWRTKTAAREETRWRLRDPFTVLAGRALSWPCMVTVWHRDPSGYDDITCNALRGRAWRWHVHHWRIQVPPLQRLRRRLLTRCAWCNGRSTKRDQADVSHQWDRPRGRWWQGETGLFHGDCSAIESAHATCVCEQPVLDYGDHGRCAHCNKGRSYGITDEALARRRVLAAIPHGERHTPATAAVPEGDGQ